MIAALLKQIHYRAIFNRDFQTIHLGGQVTKHSTTAIVRKMTFLLSREQAESLLASFLSAELCQQDYHHLTDGTLNWHGTVICNMRTSSHYFHSSFYIRLLILHAQKDSNRKMNNWTFKALRRLQAVYKMRLCGFSLGKRHHKMSQIKIPVWRNYILGITSHFLACKKFNLSNLKNTTQKVNCDLE